MGFKDKLQSSLVLAGLTGLAAIAFAILAITDNRPVGYAVAGLAMIAIGYHARGDYTSTIPAQLLVAAGALIDYHRTIGGNTAAITTGALLLALLVAEQPVLARIAERPVTRVANLPGFRPKRGLPIPPSALQVANLLLILVAGAFAIGSWPAWPLAGIFAVVALATLVIGALATRLRLRGGQEGKRLRAAMSEYKPAFVLYFSAPDATEYHVEMWRPYLERIGKPWVIMTREQKSFTTLASMMPIPVVHCPLIPNFDDVLMPSVKAVFYVNNGMKNSHMVRFTNLTHIQLLHGDSDKASSYNPVTAMFTKIFVAGQAGIDRYEANGVLIPPQKFEIVGRPQVEGIQVSHASIRDVADKVVLYATTWIGVYEDANYCSLKIGEKIIAGLLDRKVTVILRPHPYADRDAASARYHARLQQILADDRERSGRKHVFGETATTKMSLFDCANQADAMISDVSGVASDFLYSGKPFAITNMQGADTDEFEAAFPLAKAAYVVDQDGGNISSVLDELLEKDPLDEVRRTAKAYYLGEFDEARYADGFIEASRKYL